MQDSSTSAALADRADADQLEDCRACLFCGSTQADARIEGVEDVYFRADPGRFDLDRCAQCGSLWLVRRPAGERLIRAYSGYHTHTEHDNSAVAPHPLREWLRGAYYRSLFPGVARPIDRLAGKLIAATGYDTSGLDRELRYLPAPPAKVLDYGCGGGRFFRQLRGLPYRLYGVEYDPHLLAAFAEEGVEVEDAATIHDGRWDSEFDYITLAHVLEHVPDPPALLRRLFTWLKPGAGLYVELPNGGASGLAIFGRYWRGLEAPRHFAIPTRAALASALEQAGFLIERQVIDRTAREGMWRVSLAAAPEAEWPALQAAMAAAPPETADNTELLTIIARKPGR